MSIIYLVIQSRNFVPQIRVSEKFLERIESVQNHRIRRGFEKAITEIFDKYNVPKGGQ